MKKMKVLTECPITIKEKWVDSFLISYPVSYCYNGGILLDGELYKGYKVPAPKIPDGFVAVNIGIGLQMNHRPPQATVFLKPLDEKKVKKSDLKKLLKLT